MKKRLLCLFLAALMLLPLCLQALPDAQAAQKQTKTRAIGIVFDNSGSMYGANNSSWCRATYAMEVFASMMNDGDQLQVYPMWPITLGSSASASQVQIPLVIHGPQNADTIRQIYTPQTGGTPFTTVTQAYNGLLSTNADEKYLIVLTDGAFDEPDQTVSDALSQYSQDMNVMFLGIGKYVPIPTVTNPARQYYERASSSEQVLSKLTAMCNRIFGRDQLNVSGSTVEFDVSMSKIIVFVQGDNVSDVKLSGGSLVGQHAMRYSELGRGSGAFKLDTSLQGMIVTYEDLDAGSYQLSYAGNANSISVYYEPHVDLQIRLLDEGGSVADPSGTLYAGNYTMTYELVDKYGVPTDSPLLGNVNYDISYTLNGDSHHITDTKAGGIDLWLEPGATLDGTFTVQYLSDYTITKDAKAVGWPTGGLRFEARPVGDVTSGISGGMDVYQLSQLEQQAVYQVAVYQNGELLTGSDLDSAKLQVTIEDGNAIPEIRQNEDGFTVTLRYNGDAVNTQCGAQTAVFDISYTNSHGQTGLAGQTRKAYTIEDDSKALDVALQLPQNYYVISEISNADPIVISLTSGGAPLTKEQFDETSVDIRLDGVEYDLQPDPANSAYNLYLKEGSGIEPGKYKLTCTASGTDAIGRPVSDQESAAIECQPYPAILRWLFWILLFILIAALIWAYLNTKVLPKQITAGNCSFVVGGKVVPGTVICSYSGGGKKRGTLEIKSPRYSADSAMKCGMRLELVADSPRRVRSAQRTAKVVSVTPMSKANTNRMQIGATTLVKNTAGQFVRQGTKDNTNLNCSIANNTRLSVSSVVMSAVKGRKMAVSLNNLPLKFK